MTDSTHSNDALNETELSTPAFFSDLQKFFPGLTPGTLSITPQGIWFINALGNTILQLDVSTVRQIKQGYSRILFETADDKYYVIYIKRPFLSLPYPFINLFASLQSYIPFFPIFNDYYTSTIEEDQKRQHTWSSEFQRYGYPTHRWELVNARLYRKLEIGFLSGCLFMFLTLGTCVLSGVIFAKSVTESRDKSFEEMTTIPGTRSTENTYATDVPTSSVPPETTNPRPTSELVDVPTNEYKIGEELVDIAPYPATHEGQSTRYVRYLVYITNLSAQERQFVIATNCISDRGEEFPASTTTSVFAAQQEKYMTVDMYLHAETQSVDCSISRVAYIQERNL